MALKLMYITNRPEIAQIAEAAGVDRIFIDMEYIGKNARQGGMDTVQSYHTISDIRAVKNAAETAEILVRVNPIHESSDTYFSSETEIEKTVLAGADIIMLPYFKTADEVRTFIKYVGGRTRTMLLFETPESIAAIDEILDVPGIDEVFIGLNDLSLGYGKRFMFELLSDGTVENTCQKFKERGLPFGFGGIASLGKGMLPSEKIIREHYRLGSTSVILSRSFCNVNKISHMGIISSTFVNGIREIREYEKEVEQYAAYFKDNKREITKIVETIRQGELS